MTQTDQQLLDRLDDDLDQQTHPTSFTTADVLSMTGLSFRVLDYWLRTGAVKLADGATPGSGVVRTYTLSEVEAIQCLVDRYTEATAEINAIRSGKAWATLTSKPSRRR